MVGTQAEHRGRRDGSFRGSHAGGKHIGSAFADSMDGKVGQLVAFTGVGGVWAMSPGKYQAVNYPGTQAGIQQALNDCSAPSVTGVGGKVIVGPGVYPITSPLSNGLNTILQGMGRYTTVI